MKQTAVEWLVEQLAKNGILHSSDINKAKAMEKEHIENAFNESRKVKNYKGERTISCLDLDDYTDVKFENFEQYYNETFKS